ncbi:MAG: sigma-54-dependent Fis family transcriptional regulator [Candidatus Aminicenantes bacterium]|nr:sigma-54-dependent Fis family transcriptional regulator [Candidatus Aminicenantes bacterium]TFG58529.1 MAG: sigma-54-dependent Fis family transcriptional regulator [Candidatus Aminicenantes bacterium]
MEAQTNLLIISDDFSLYETIKKAPVAVDFNVFFSQTEDDYLAVVRENGIRVVLVDSGDSLAAGLLVLKKIKKSDALIDVLVGGEPIGQEAVLDMVHAGATDFIPKPFERDILQDVLRRISRKRELRRETLHLEKKLERKYVFRGLISRNPYMLEIFGLIENIAKYFSSALITGETGTGKEVVARALHGLSPYAEKPLVICDCASIPENLFESELFGYKKGAFTGADKDKPGMFDEADGGVIFLDEIAEIPVAVQAKLLRVLENHEFRPLGANETTAVEVRVLAATNRDLAEMVRAGTFREDLFHRLNKVTIDLPPLRERPEDIPLLIRHFLQGASRNFSKNVRGVSREVQKLFLKYGWPGNIRELANVLESAAMLCKKDFIDVANLPKYLRDYIPPQGAIAFAGRGHLSSLDDLEKDYIVYLLKVAKGNMRQTAKILGISRTTLYNKLAKYKIRN